MSVIIMTLGMKVIFIWGHCSDVFF